MGTSNWQNIPLNIEVLMKIAPSRVLDVGVGFGRWGMIIREFCDVWFGRILQPDWQVHIEGIEAFEKNISTYHESFYNRIHIGDAREIIYKLNDPWDLVIFGDVLEHFERQTAEEILDWCLRHSTYIMINLPLGSGWPQEDLYKNPFEKHLSLWSEDDFNNFSMVRKAKFLDFQGRPFGVFILSREDPKKIKDSLFSTVSAYLPFEDLSTNNSSGIYLNALELKNDQLTAELANIKNSQAYQFIEKSRKFPGRNTLVKIARFFLPSSSQKQPHSLNASMEKNGEAAKENNSTFTASSHKEIPRWKEADVQWLSKQLQDLRPLSINNPEWRGILSSARELFDNQYLIPDNLVEKNSTYFATLIHEARPPSITIQGFPLSYYHLVKAFRKINRQTPIFVIWHGNYLQNKEDYAWSSFKLVKQLIEEGDIQKVGFVKKGMAEVMPTTGMPAYFIMNYVRRIPDHPSQPRPGGPHIGVWGEPDYGWRKPPYAMLAALSLVPHASAQVINVSPRSKDFGDWFHLDASYHTRVIPGDEVIKTLAEMHLNMYVTLSECAPMLPLESLSLGVPCLLGPTSHYFLDHDYLLNRLVVPYPDHAEIIAEKANLVLAERDMVIEAYRHFAVEYNRQAVSTISDFLEFPMTVPAEPLPS